MKEQNNDNPQVDIIGIGAQKAATSWIARMLEEHPEICMARGKETHFFSKQEKYKQGNTFYVQYFTHCPPEKRKAEFSTSYLASKDAPQRIKKAFPNARIIVSLRHPVERAFSHITHLQSKKNIPENVSVREAVELRPDIIEHGMYGKHLKQYLDIFPKEQIHIVWYTDIMENPERVVGELYAFLGVDESFVPSHTEKRFNTSAHRRSVLFRLVNQTHLFLRRYQWGRKLIQGMKRIGIRGSLFSAPDTNPPKWSEKDRAFLGEKYKEDNELLQSLIGEGFDVTYDRDRQ